jgi:hypothetical protein
MRHTLKIAFVGLIGLIGSTARASLTGTNVTGSLTFSNSTNFFDSTNNGVNFGVPSSGYLNSNNGPAAVSISTAIPEFGYQVSGNTIRADFGSSTLLINDTVATTVVAAHYSFTDAAFAGQAVAESSDTFPGGVTYALSGTTLTINYTGTQTAGDYNAVFVFTAVPEPTGLALGSLALFGLMRRRSSSLN